jgi:hypothetical protein
MTSSDTEWGKIIVDDGKRLQMIGLGYRYTDTYL